MANAKTRRIPWVLWLKDILPDGAVATGFVREESGLYEAARRFELAAYRSAAHVFVLSETFRQNLLEKGVPEEKLTRVYDPATRPIEAEHAASNGGAGSESPRVLCMGNIGRSQGLPAIVRAFEADDELAKMNARLVLTGTGVAAEEVADVITTDRVEMPGLLSEEELRDELVRATLGAVTQHYSGSEFNVPSKVMNYFASGLPVIASVHPEGEVAHLLCASSAGWVTNSADPPSFARCLVEALRDQDELRIRGRAAREFASRSFTPEAMAEVFEERLEELAFGIQAKPDR